MVYLAQSYFQCPRDISVQDDCDSSTRAEFQCDTCDRSNGELCCFNGCGHECMLAIEEQCYILSEDDDMVTDACRQERDCMADRMKGNKNRIAIEFITRTRDRTCVDDTDCCVHNGFYCQQRGDDKKCVRGKSLIQDEDRRINRLNQHSPPKINGIFTVDVDVDSCDESCEEFK